MKALCKNVVCAGAHAKALMRMALVLAFLTAGGAMAYAQTMGTTPEYGTADGIDKLSGIDPSTDVVAGAYNTDKPSDGSKLLCFYNVGTGKFLSIGGLWGTHASISSTPYALWLETVTGYTDRFWVRNSVTGSGTGSHIGISGPTQLNMDRSDGNGARHFMFEKAEEYTADNRLYYIKALTYGNNTISAYNYITTYPDNEERYCNVETTKYDPSDSRHQNQLWKIISRDEYYTLALANPANMESVIDFSFLIKAPNFRVNDTEMSNWVIGGNATQQPDLRFGDNLMYCTYANRGVSGKDHFNKYNEAHQQNYGKLFYCYAKASQGFNLYQDIQIHKDGWYLLRCNGFSTQQETQKNGSVKPRAHLFAVVVKDGVAQKELKSTSTLNLLSTTQAQALMQADADGTGTGRAFFEGEYENQVQLCIDDKMLQQLGIGTLDTEHPLTLRVGFEVDQYDDASNLTADDVTCVDNFTLLYAGPRRNPELILDENNNNLRYLTRAKDEYKNSVLHLRRTLNDHQWNSLILPVDLTFGQMKRTFGDGVKVAKLTSISNGVVRFLTVEPKKDDEVMVQAFTPYIIYPPVVETTSQPYTADRFYTSEGEDNAHWLAADSTSVSTDENDRYQLTIPANHYDITMVSLDRERLAQYIDEEADNWISQTTLSTGAAPGNMTCYGTLAKTFSENGVLTGRDRLSGDYIMLRGKLIQVPSNSDYGLLGFRCWFEVKGQDNIEHPAASNLRLSIDGVVDDATAISDINAQPNLFTSRHKGIDGVFNLNGQRLRQDNDTKGLPMGIYIVNGKKVVVR